MLQVGKNRDILLDVKYQEPKKKSDLLQNLQLVHV